MRGYYERKTYCPDELAGDLGSPTIPQAEGVLFHLVHSGAVLGFFPGAAAILVAPLGPFVLGPF